MQFYNYTHPYLSFPNDPFLQSCLHEQLHTVGGTRGHSSTQWVADHLVPVGGGGLGVWFANDAVYQAGMCPHWLVLTTSREKITYEALVHYLLGYK